MPSPDPSRRPADAEDTDLTPLVTVIVPTRNSERYLRECLSSIRDQGYSNIELIVVDNASSDGTVSIARAFADSVYRRGPERSAQVNFGARRANGDYIFRVDADFRLEPGVISECVSLSAAGADAVVVHNTPDASVGLLARIRKFEVDMYKYSLNHSAARFISRDLFLQVGGLRDDVTAGEDYDFQNRLTREGARVLFASAEAIHLDEPTRLLPLLRKYFKYGKDFPNYYRYNREDARGQLAFVRRDYLHNWRAFVERPWVAVMFVGYHILKFAVGAAGFASGMIDLHRIGSASKKTPVARPTKSYRPGQ